MVISSVCPSLLLGNQIKNFRHISKTVSITTNQLNPILLSDALSSFFNRVLLHKLLLPQRVNRFPASFEAQSFITACTKGAKCPYPEPEECSLLTPHHIFKVHFNIVFPSMTRTSKLFLTFTVANNMQPVVTTWFSYLLVRESNAKLLTNRNGGELGVTWSCPTRLHVVSRWRVDGAAPPLPITHYAVHTDQFTF